VDVVTDIDGGTVLAQGNPLAAPPEAPDDLIDIEAEMVDVLRRDVRAGIQDDLVERGFELGPDLDVFSALASLVEKSLVRTSLSADGESWCCTVMFGTPPPWRRPSIQSRYHG